MATLGNSEFRKGKAIVREGTHGTSAFIIVKGKVEVSKMEPGGAKKVICVLKEKDIFGEMGLIAGWPRTATCIALEDCEVTVLTREIFQTLPDANPGKQRIKAIMAERLKGKDTPTWMKAPAK